MNSTSNSHNPRCVADALGLGWLSDDVPTVDPQLLRGLYRHARGEDGQRHLFQNNQTFAKGWVNLEGPHASSLISVFVPLDEADKVKQARRMAQTNLESQPWNDILSIDSPPIVCKIKIHGTKWGLRFQSAEPAMRGREPINEDLPPIPADDCSDNIHDQPEADSDSTQKISCPTAEDVLRKAGMPS